MTPIRFLILSVFIQLFVLGSGFFIIQSEIKDTEKRDDLDTNFRISSVKQEIEHYLKLLKIKTSYIVRLHHDLILKKQLSLENTPLIGKLGKLIRLEIPTLYAFTLANNEGAPILGNIDGFIGKGCKKSIIDFSTSDHGEYEMRMHQMNGIDHFDIIIRLTEQLHGSNAVFFISLEPTQIIKILKRYSSEEQHILITKITDKKRIEITGDGSRAQINRSLELSDDEIKQIVSSLAIENTAWEIQALTVTNFAELQVKKIYLHHGLPTIALFIFIFTLSILIFKRLNKAKFIEDALDYSVADAIIIVNDKWQISHINKQAEKLLHSSEEDLSQISIWDRYPDFSSHFFIKLRKANIDKTDTKITIKGYYPPTNRWLTISTYHHHHSEFALCISDVTLEHLDHEQVRWLSALLDNLNEGVITIDRHGLIRTFNTIASQLFGYSENELIGVNIKHLTPDDIAEKHDFYLERRIKTGIRNVPPGSSREVMGKHKNGTLFPIELSLNEQNIGDELIFIGTIHDRKKHQEKIDEMEHSITHDALTGAYNKHFLQGYLPIMISKAKRNNHLLALLFCDLDKFKQVNDTLGHDAGDQLLKIAVERMHATIRESDQVIRWGGDEFVVILNDISDQQIGDRIAKNLIEQLSKPFELINGEAVIGCSIGISLYPEDGDTPDELQKAADRAMYAAKRRGRGNYYFAADL